MPAEPYQFKPTIGTPIDWTQPLAQGLQSFFVANETAGNTLYDATGNLNLAAVNFGATNPWGSGPSGPGIVTNGAANTAGYAATLPTALRFGWPATIACAVRLPGSPSTGARIFGLHTTNTSTAPFAAITIFSQSATQVGIGYATGGSGNFPATYATITQGLDYVFSLTVGPGGVAFYSNGALVYSAAGTGISPTWTANALMFLGNATYVSLVSAVSPLYWGGLWTGPAAAWSPAQHAAIGGGPSAIYPQLYGQPRSAWLMRAAAVAGTKFRRTLGSRAGSRGAA